MKENSINAFINNNCNRRKFVKDTLTGIGTVAFGSFILVNQSGCSDGGPTSPSDNNGSTSITVDLSFPENSALLTIGGTLALGANELDGLGMLLYRQSESTVKCIAGIVLIMVVP